MQTVDAKVLAWLSDAALAAVSHDTLLEALAPVARELLAADHLHLIELSPDAAVGHARVVALDGSPAQDYTMVLDERSSGTARTAASREVLHVADAASSDDLRPDFTERFEVGSALFVPLIWEGEPRWVCVVIRKRQAPFTPEEIELARLILNQHAAGLALLEARAASAAQQGHDAALARAAAAINATLDLSAVLEALTREADLALGGDMAGVYLGDGEQGGIATAGHNVPAGWLGYHMRPGEGVGGRVLQTGLPAFSNAYQSEIELPSNPGLRRLQTAVAVPMAWEGSLKGALSIGFEHLRRIDPADLRTLEAFADLATVACRNAEAFQRLEAALRQRR